MSGSPARPISPSLGPAFAVRHRVFSLSRGLRRKETVDMYAIKNWQRTTGVSPWVSAKKQNPIRHNQATRTKMLCDFGKSRSIFRFPVTRKYLSAHKKTLSVSFLRPQSDQFIHTAQVEIPLGKGNLDVRFPESPINLLVKVTFCQQPIIGIQYRVKWTVW